MGESHNQVKLPSYASSFRRLLGGRCRRRGNKQERRKSSQLDMGQTKSVPTDSIIKSVTPAPSPMTLQLSNTNRNRIEGGNTTMVTLSRKDKKHKSRSISSLSKALRNRRWRKKRRGSISASFNMNEKDIKVELMNVNQATEEELMTLPGVSRALARNIVSHRNQIGGYKRVDDLALVSGMGATKLDLIRKEICTPKKPNLSRDSSKSQSTESLPSSSGSSRVYRPPKPLNLNTATVFELMGVQGINQALAAKIITHRDKRGPFKYVEDLRQVGISYRQLGALRTYLTVTSSEAEQNRGNKVAMSPQSQTVPTPTMESISNGPLLTTVATSHRRSSSVPPVMKKIPAILFETTKNELDGKSQVPNARIRSSYVEDMTEIFELMSLKSRRPLQDCSFSLSQKNRPTYRVASWNLEKLSLEKISNLGVLEVITRTILENGLSLVALQEICDKLALQKICDELNEPKLSRNRAWRKPRGKWAFLLDENSLHFNKASHRMGVLYNENVITGVTIPKSSTTFSPIQNGSLWEFSVFNVCVKNTSWILVNVLSTPLSQYTNGQAVDHQHENVGTMIQLLVKETRADGGLLLGSFTSQNLEKGLGKLQDLKNISPRDEEGIRTGPVGSFWITNGMEEFFAGENGCITEGLSHLAIPNGWTWGGRVTTSEPFWCSFYDSESIEAL